MESLLMSPKGVPMELTDCERGQLPQSWGRVLTPEEIAALADPSVCCLLPGRPARADGSQPPSPSGLQFAYIEPLGRYALECGPAAKG